MNNRELTHYGIPGQKWGVRRFQYENGSYTPEGKERYGRVATSDQNNTEQNKSAPLISNNKDNVKKLLIGAGIVSLVAVGGYLALKSPHNSIDTSFPKNWPLDAISGNKATRVLSKHFSKDISSQLSDEEKDAIYSYTGDDYEGINFLLEKKDEFGNSPYRNIGTNKSIRFNLAKNPDLKEKYLREIDLIEKAIDKSSTPQDLVVTRKTSFGNLRGMFGDGITAKDLASLLSDPDKAIGKTLTFDGFCSTSVRDDLRRFGGTNLHIFVPKGSKGMYVESLSRNPIEKEFLLQKGQRFKLVDVRNLDVSAESVYFSAVDLFLELIND